MVSAPITPADARRLARLVRESGLSVEQVEAILRERQDAVPVSIFATDVLSPLEAIVKYLRENRGLRLVEIAEIVGRDQREIGVAYRRAAAKAPAPLVVGESRYYFPLAVLKDRRLSVAEHLVAHLLQQHRLRYAQIAMLLRRDQRTVWTIAKRAWEKASR